MGGKLAALLTGMALLAGCSEAAPATYTAGTEYQVAVIGDSFTTGSEVGGVGPSGWPALVKKDLDNQNLHLDIRSAAEASAGYAVRGTYGGVFGDQVSAVVGVTTDLVVFFGSTNDGVAPPDELRAAVHDDLAKAKAYAPHAKLLAIGPTWPAPDPPVEMLGVRDILRDQALAAGAVFVDPLAEHWIADAPQLMGADVVHPTDDGHKYLAQRIAPIIANTLTHG
jgi:lysophospholipase L1-like esterase